jgi:hypothetical protein
VNGIATDRRFWLHPGCSWKVAGDILHQSLFMARGSGAGGGPPPPHVVACSLELVVVNHECRAWARRVLGVGDVGACLADLVEVRAGEAYG